MAIKNKKNKCEISFLDTVRTTTQDVDVIASRIAMRKLLDLGWEVADLNNLVPFSYYHLVGAYTFMEFLKMGSIGFLKDNLKHMAYRMKKQDEIRHESYIGYDNDYTIAKRNQRERKERRRGECSRDKLVEGVLTHVVYSNRKHEAPRLLFFHSYAAGDKRCWRIRFVEIPKDLARLILKILPDRDKFVPIDYLILNPDGYLFVELKANRAKLSKKQLEVSKMIENAGYKVVELHISLNLGLKAEVKCGEVRVV